MAAGLVIAALSAYLAWPRLHSTPQWVEAFSPEDAGWTQEVLPRVADQIEEAKTTTRDLEIASVKGAQAQVQIGANRVDLDAAIRLSNRVSAVDAFDRLIAAAKGLPSKERELAVLEALRGELRDADETTLLSAEEGLRLRQAAQKLRRSDAKRPPVLQDLGVWAEAGWLAAGARHLPFFAREKNRRFLDWLLEDQKERRPSIPLTRNGQKALRALDEEWPRQDLTVASSEPLKAAFNDLRDGSAIAPRAAP